MLNLFEHIHRIGHAEFISASPFHKAESPKQVRDDRTGAHINQLSIIPAGGGPQGRFHPLRCAVFYSASIPADAGLKI